MKRNVVVTGWGQVNQPKRIEGDALDPIGLMAKAAQRAAGTMKSSKILTSLDGIMVVRIVSRHYSEQTARLLSDKLGAAPKFTYDSEVGGNSSQTLVNMAAGMIARNELDSILVAGAEAYVQRGEKPPEVDSALFGYIPEHLKDDSFVGATPLEETHGMVHPIHGFPLFETALWAESGLDLATYLLKVGKMWAGFSEVAATHPYAWSKTARTVNDIITPGPSNRPIAFPYTKFMTSFVTVDLGSAVILMSEEAAKKYAQKDKQTVYFLGGGDARDRQRFMIEKSDFTICPPMEAAAKKALERACLTLEKIDCFDLYSCFPSAVSMAKKMLGISDDDPRPLTLTGGLGFFGGPGNNYSLHGIATLAQKIAKGEKKNGLVTSLGWFMHKHAAGIYGSEPPGKGLNDGNLDDQKNPLCGNPPVSIKEEVTGSGTIETYTVVYDAEHQPSYGLIYGQTDDQCRFIARTVSDPGIYDLLTTQNMVGKKVFVNFDESININIADIK